MGESGGGIYSVRMVEEGVRVGGIKELGVRKF
jgi:hypothetical protein